MSERLYRWPPAAKFGKVVPKTKFYEHATISATVREKFVTEVQRITWAYKLADKTVHLRGNDAVPEIQVFSIDAKGQDIGDDVLAAIDKAIQFPIIFEINRSEGDSALTRMAASYKQLAGTIPRLSAYFTTRWLRTDDPRAALPPSLDLPGLYAALLTPILPFARQPGEGVSDVTSRIDQARKLEREIATLERKLRTEPQLNRKVELRRQLLDREALLTEITAAKIQKTEDVPWTS